MPTIRAARLRTTGPTAHLPSCRRIICGTRTAIEFDREAIVAAIRQSQRGEHTFADFVRKTTAAGCVGYFVQIHGRRAIYFGRNGDEHVEMFPSAT